MNRAKRTVCAEGLLAAYYYTSGKSRFVPFVRLSVLPRCRIRGAQIDIVATRTEG